MVFVFHKYGYNIRYCR